MPKFAKFTGYDAHIIRHIKKKVVNKNIPDKVILDKVILDKVISDKVIPNKAILGSEIDNINNINNIINSYLAFRKSSIEDIQMINSTYTLCSNGTYSGIPIINNRWYILLATVDMPHNITITITCNKIHDNNSYNVLFKSIEQDNDIYNYNISLVFMMDQNLNFIFSEHNDNNRLKFKLIGLEDSWRGISFNKLELNESNYKFSLIAGKEYGSVPFVRNRPYLIFTEVHNAYEKIVDIVLANSGLDEHVTTINSNKTVNIQEIIIPKVTYCDNSDLIIALSGSSANHKCNLALIDLLDTAIHISDTINIHVKDNYIINNLIQKSVYLFIGKITNINYVDNTVINIKHNNNLYYCQHIPIKNKNNYGLNFTIFFESIDDSILIELLGNSDVKISCKLVRLI